MAGPSAKHERADVRRPQPDGTVWLIGPNLRVRVAVLKPGIVLATARGEVVVVEDSEVEAALLAELDREIQRSGSLSLFADLRQSERMPASSRETITHWTRRQRDALRPSHVLVKSKLLEMAVSVLTMLIGGGLIEIHSRPLAFLALVQRVAPQVTELPTAPMPRAPVP